MTDPSKGIRLLEARLILSELGLPKPQTNLISGLTLMALARINEESRSWGEATATSYTIRKGIMDYVADVLKKPYAENSREQFRRKVLHQFVQAGICLYNPDAPDTATNSQNNHYRLSPEALRAIQSYGTPLWDIEKKAFLLASGSLAQKYSGARELEMVPVTLPDGTEIKLSPGEHNRVQAAIVHDFGSRFAKGAVLLYLGDTTEKDVFRDDPSLNSIGISLTTHDKMPDVVMYDRQKNWLFLIEAVTSHGPMSPKRLEELKPLLAKCTAGVVYVSAFPNLTEFKRHAADIAWDTEVWFSDNPDHMLHFNGDRFMGPR